MKVFITASNAEAALYWKAILTQNQHTITSTWHDREMTSTSSKPVHERTKLADSSFEEIKNCDVLLLLSSPDMVPGGKFVDAGVAIGLGKKVIVVGRRENLKMWASVVTSVDTQAECLAKLACHEVVAV